MEKLIFATGNSSKGQRFSEGLFKRNIEIQTLKDIKLELTKEENGKTAIENAIIKAKECFEKTKMPSMGMDDTLYLEGVPEEKQPGLFVRRVNGKTLTDEEMLDHYIDLVNKYGKDGKLYGKWIYGLAVINREGLLRTYTWEKADFYMTNEKSEIVNPGYPLNTISKYTALDKYFTEVKKEDMEKIKQDETHVVDFIYKSLNTMESEGYIGKTVDVVIDRAFGSKHPKHGFIYPVNYGYIKDTISGDGEELDCYVLGVYEPLETFKGKCIAVLRRTNDNDDKLIVVPEDKNYTDDQIDALTEFQEQYFKHKILRKRG